MEKLTLMIKFIATQENHEKFKEELLNLFSIIEKEENFISSIVHQNVGKKEEFMVYEVWNDNIDNFMAVQMKKQFVQDWEKLLIDMNIVREPSLYIPIGKFGTTN